MIFTILLTLLNAGLVALPIGGTVAVLGGIDYHRRITGQAPLFSTPKTSGGGGNGNYSSGNYSSGNYSSNYTGWDGNKPNATTVVGGDNGTTNAEYCQKYNAVLIATTTGQNYTINPNQWGWNDTETGGLCVNITTNNNDTYTTNTTAPPFTITWEYPAGPVDQPVHAFPNIMINNTKLPSKLGSLSKMNLDVSWTYSRAGVLVSNQDDTVVAAASSAAAAATVVAATSAAAVADTTSAAAAAVATTKVAAAAGTTTTPASGTTKAAAAKGSTAATVGRKDKRRVSDVDFWANVAVDMFFDKEKEKSTKTNNATYEVMVWLGVFGPDTNPIGEPEGIVATHTLSGYTFNLYYGTNIYNQHVLTWLCATTATDFSGSIHELVTILPSIKNLTYYPSSTDYIGYFAFGGEAYQSTTSVTLDVPKLAMEVS